MTTEMKLAPVEPTEKMLEAFYGAVEITRVGSVRHLPDGYRAMLAAAPDPWQPIETAPKDGTPILAVLRDLVAMFPRRPDLARWSGKYLPLRHNGIADDGFDIGWEVSAPVGHGGFPDEWIAGWMPLPAPPADGGGHEG